MAIELNETKSLRLALSSLKARPVDWSTFEDLKHIESNGWLRVWPINRSRSYFISRRIPLDVLDGVIASLRGEPADTAEMRVALYELWLITKHRKMAEDDMEAFFGVYTKKLSEYPASHVRLVMAEMASTESFFPTWADIQKRLDDISEWRSRLLVMLHRARTEITTQET